MNQRKFSRLEFVMGVLSLLLNIVGTVLFFASYTTGYYKFGEMNSPMILPFSWWESEWKSFPCLPW
ncbi:hypothetical protein DW904_02445 [Ruminococcus sp. AM42-11]|uniref:hypothetical protein n=1 Tax=Ruminococcus sp. AM42-11 TaxID=2292372 RepID=UPI000E493DC3|nr:hypothetical protein [Ruminococcus sp. AM42-11]RHT03345.1 hypothetical protein DW904_02445 [Ruminococcus sp. AM42-11]